MTNLATLPLTLQVALAIGYLSARLAAAGTHYAQKATDTILQTLVFAALASMVVEVVSSAGGNLWIAVPTAAIASLAAAAAWQWFGRCAVVKVLKCLKITNEDFQPSTLDSIIQANHGHQFLGVYTKDGTYYGSMLGRLSKEFPHYPYTIDSQGSVAFYVTSMTNLESGEKTDFTQEIEYFRRKKQTATVTYIPAAEIVKLDFLKDIPPRLSLSLNKEKVEAGVPQHEKEGEIPLSEKPPRAGVERPEMPESGKFISEKNEGKSS